MVLTADGLSVDHAPLFSDATRECSGDSPGLFSDGPRVSLDAPESDLLSIAASQARLESSGREVAMPLS